MYKKLSAPLEDKIISELKAGDRVLLQGRIYAARDAAHKRMCDALVQGKELPFDIAGQIIYYAGPCPPKPGFVSGPFGPTTAGRMDSYTPQLLGCGLKAMVGKGERSKEVMESMKQNKAVYLAAVGGAGALIATRITQIRTIAYEDLGAEAIVELQVEDLPVIVAVDCHGNNLYASEPEKFKNRFDI